MSQTIESDIRLHQNQTQKRSQKQHKRARLICMVSILSLGTIYCGYTIAYIVALGTGNLKLIYGQAAGYPVVKAFLIASLPFGLAGLIQFQHLAAFFVVRFLQGALVGLFLVLVPIFVKQITPIQISKKIIFGVFEKLFVLLGFALPFTFNTVLLKKDIDETVRWRIVITVDSLPLLILFLLIVTKVVPQSPNSLIEKGKEAEAKKVIAFFHDEEVINQAYEFKKEKSRLKTFLTFQIPILHQMTGVNAYISQMGFVTSQFHLQFSEFVPLLMTCSQLIAAILSMIYISRITPRKILMTGNLGMSLCCFVIAICLIVIKSRFEAFWSIIAFLTLFMALNGGTFIPAIGLYVAEVGNRKTIRWSLVGNWFMCGWSIVIFITIGDRFGFATVFMFFGIVSILFFVLNLFIMIQTKPKLKKHSHIELRPQQIKQKNKLSPQNEKEDKPKQNRKVTLSTKKLEMKNR